jgi:hypothetical protein
MSLSEKGYTSAEPGGMNPETSQLLRKVLYGTTSKITLFEAATELDLHSADVRDFIRDLVPVAA